jgi:hypothetical protein
MSARLNSPNRQIASALPAAAALCLLVCATGSAEAQQGRAATPDGDTVVVTPGEEFAASGLHKLIFGEAYRALWAAPIEVEVLDLATEAGGLEPVMEVGRLQTVGLALRGADGRAYTFRGVYKDLVRGLPEQLQNTAVADIAQDQLAAGTPTGSSAAIALARAAGVLQPQPRLVVMPDDPRLGEFREKFAGLLGTLAEFPTGADSGAGTFGADRIVDAREMLVILDSGEGQIDAHAFLRARLVDLLLGDWDRHVGQWRFALIPGIEAWQPISEDRDQAFSRYEGLAMAMARNREPKFDVYGASYQGMEGLTWNARSVDRGILGGLDREAYVQAARRIQEQLTDDVIEESLRRFPPEHFAIVGEELVEQTKNRRDNLVDQAEKFYEFLSGQTNLFGTNRDELVEIEFAGDAITVGISPLAQAGGACDARAGGARFVERRFVPDDTSSIRIYTGDGSDRVVLKGRDPGAIDVKIVGGNGQHAACDLEGREHRFDYSTAENSGKGPSIARNVWLSPAATLDDAAEPESSQGPTLRARRDWGSTSYTAPIMGWSPDPGLTLGMTFIKEHFAFRKRPYGAHHELRARLAFGVLRPAFEYSGIFRSENRRFYWSVRGIASGIEGLNFYGFGNETENTDDDEFYRVRQNVFGTNVRAAWVVGENVTVSTGPAAYYTTTREDENRLIGQTLPYGSEDLGQAGWTAGINFNNQRFPGNRNLKGSDDIFRFGPSPLGAGLSLDVDAAYYPKAWDLAAAYGKVTAKGSFTGILGSGTAIQLLLGGATTWGDVPYFDAAYVGSHEVRGLRQNRFAGNDAAYANVGLMQRVGKLTLVIPGRWGVVLRGDTGRVWLDGEDSDTWHWSYGGGLWWAPWDLMNAIRVVYFTSDDDSQFYFLMGFEI